MVGVQGAGVGLDMTGLLAVLGVRGVGGMRGGGDSGPKNLMVAVLAGHQAGRGSIPVGTCWVSLGLKQRP